MRELPLVRVTCALVERQDLVLVTQRSQLMSQPLLWEFPGGKIEAGEAETACLVREIKEELQIDIVPEIRLTPILHNYSNFRIELIPYICGFRGGEIHLAEHLAFAWAAPATLLNYSWCPADIPVVAEYLKRRRGGGH